ncbi:Lrp/AsnC family transcriptional regulator [Streptomyces sp. NPDC050743]|uniref:Lrp/AsnC family transcriptional regulator n=1 Tax=Streptomyces sp. NPDC050743 TaxID=3365634 RepID=UPI0037B3CD47
MQDDARLLSDDELALIHAMQLQPRASWTELGRVLGVDPVTVARWWGRLAERGEAWVGFSPGPRMAEQLCAAFVDIDCAAANAAAVSRVLSGHPHVVNLERAAGAHQLLATVATTDLAAMSPYTLDVLPTVPGVSVVRARIITHVFTEGGRWRIGALARAQRAQLTAPAGSTTVPPTRQVTTFDRALMARLAPDGRASHQALADAMGTSASTVKRRLDQLARTGTLRFRCDFARPLGGWPVAVTFWVTVPPADLPDVGHALVRLSDVRACLAITGPHNLVLQAYLRSAEDVLPLRNPDRHRPPRYQHRRANDHLADRQTSRPPTRPSRTIHRRRTDRRLVRPRGVRKFRSGVNALPRC